MQQRRVLRNHRRERERARAADRVATEPQPRDRVVLGERVGERDHRAAREAAVQLVALEVHVLKRAARVIRQRARERLPRRAEQSRAEPSRAEPRRGEASRAGPSR